MSTLQIKRGLEANLPSSGLAVGELLFTTDTHRLFVATAATTMQEYLKQTTLGTAAAANTGTGSGNVPVLDGSGKLASSVLPAIAITTTSVVASEVAQLALTAQEGDVAVRTDETKSYLHNGGSAGDMTDWTLLLSPTGDVVSVNSKTGVVVLDADDISDAATTNKFVTAADITKLGNLSNTNTGDQTSIVGISGTKAQFNTACTDGTFVYTGGNVSDLTNDSGFITAGSTTTLTEKTFDAAGSGNVLSNVAVSHMAAAAVVLESEGIASNDNDTTLPTSAAVKDYVDTAVSVIDGGTF